MTDEININLTALSIQKGIVPRYLYKYRSLTEIFDQLLVNNQLWFSTPNNFNDPFDCQVTINTKNSQFEIESYLKSHSQKVKSEERVKRISKVMAENPKKLNELINGTINGLINSLGICCFCENRDNHLLWSHYADGHKGVCLKFDIQLDLDFFSLPSRMVYQSDYPVYNFINNPPVEGEITGTDEMIGKLLLTKSNLWSYEQEVRIIKKTSGLHYFKKGALVELIFGSKTNIAEINRIKTLAMKNGYEHLNYKKAILKKTKYGLDFIEI